MTAEFIAQALLGRKVGDGWTALCPAHDDRKPSLSINCGVDNKILVRCHAGCEQRDVIAGLKRLGLWEQVSHSATTFSHRKLSSLKQSQPAELKGVSLSLWQSSVSASSTLAETYLASRGLGLPQSGALRFHKGLKHPLNSVWPAMVALVTRGIDGLPIAVHRTFLDRNGAGKAPVSPAKMMLGPCRGGVVRLGDPDGVLMIGEGIETCLAAMHATGHSAWAALSTSGLRSLDLPGMIRDVIVLADGDDPGEAAAGECALRWKREGRRVRIARPPRGADFNDMLIGCALDIEGGLQ